MKNGFYRKQKIWNNNFTADGVANNSGLANLK